MEAGGSGGAGGAGGGSGGGAGGVGGGSGTAGGTAGCPGYANCTNFTAGTSIDFGGGNDRYVPKCLRLTAGQAVTFMGNFNNHPMHQACGPVAQALGATSGTNAQFTLTVPGVYGFYCSQHGDSTGTGMAGAIEVVP